MYVLFQDRKQAGEALGAKLVDSGWKSHLPQRIFGLARGGIAVAGPVAEQLGLPLEVLVVRKIGAPENEEFGVGAICEDGAPIFAAEALAALHLRVENLHSITERKRHESLEKISKYRGQVLQWTTPPHSVLVIDDGLATGISAEAAARYLRQRGVERITLAVPVAATDSARRLTAPRKLYDEVIALERIDNLGSIGSWYNHFSQVSDDEVLAYLAKTQTKAA